MLSVKNDEFSSEKKMHIFLSEHYIALKVQCLMLFVSYQAWMSTLNTKDNPLCSLVLGENSMLLSAIGMCAETPLMSHLTHKCGGRFGVPSTNDPFRPYSMLGVLLKLHSRVGTGHLSDFS